MSAPVLLFACVHNSGRSVAARVLAEHHGQGRVQARSAGSQPCSSLNSTVVQVLHELGLSTADETPTLLTGVEVQAADVVITMGCGETCPVLPGKTYEDWQVEDPKDKDLETVRRIVADIDERVRELIGRLS